MRAVRTSAVLAAFTALLAVVGSHAFATGSCRVGSFQHRQRQHRPVRSEPTELYAAAGGGASKKAKKAKKASGESFTKADFVASVAEKTGLAKVDAERSLAAVLETIVENVANGKKINLVGFGSFDSRPRAARKGRHPKTGEEIDIPASNLPAFTASKKFKEACN